MADDGPEHRPRTQVIADDAQGMVAFLGVAADRRLLEEDLGNLPEVEQHHEPPMLSRRHDRLVAAGSLATGATLVGGVAMALYGGWQVLFHDGGTLDTVLLLTGILLAGTHWGWVHVAEYLGLSIDERHHRTADGRRQEWLASIQPYPRYSVSTSVREDASTSIERVLHRPVLTAEHTFTFARETQALTSYDADVSAEVIAATLETMRRRARLDSDRLQGLWGAASTAYAATLLSARDDQQLLAARRAAAIALSEHLNASLLEPPLVE